MRNLRLVGLKKILEKKMNKVNQLEKFDVCVDVVNGESVYNFINVDVDNNKVYLKAYYDGEYVATCTEDFSYFIEEYGVYYHDEDVVEEYSIPIHFEKIEGGYTKSDLEEFTTIQIDNKEDD